MAAGTPARPRGEPVAYPDVRAQIQDGDVLLFQGTHWLSRLIRWGSKSPYSHAGVALWWGPRLMVVQAVGKGVEAVPLSHAVDRYSGGTASVMWSSGLRDLWLSRNDGTGENFSTTSILAYPASSPGAYYRNYQAGWTLFSGAPIAP